jgi:hypothetical protein
MTFLCGRNCTKALLANVEHRSSNFLPSSDKPTLGWYEIWPL